MAPTSLATALAALSLATVIAPGCTSSSTVVDEAEAPAPSAAAETSAPAPSGTPAAETAKPVESAVPAASATPAAGGKKAGGAACDAAAECDSGICEGEGCGAGQGKCADKERKCTMDLRAYCGCDGKTFNGGGNCPKARFSKRGACDGDPGPGPRIPAPKKP